MIEHPAPQGSAEWDRAHLGIITSRHADRLVTPAKLQPARGRGPAKLLAELLAEWATGEPWTDPGETAWMERGRRLEPEAVAYYRALRDGVEVRVPGLIYRDESRLVGTSPDLWASGHAGPIEIKCPAAPRHIANLLACEILPGVPTDEPPSGYEMQVQWHMWVTGAAWCDWMSYHDEIAHQVLVRVPRRDAYMQAFEAAVFPFLERLEDGRRRLRDAGIVPVAEAAPASEPHGGPAQREGGRASRPG